MDTRMLPTTLGSSHYLWQGGGANKGGAKGGGKISVQAFSGGGGKISVHRDLKAVPKHPENTLKIFRQMQYHYFCQCT